MFANAYNAHLIACDFWRATVQNKYMQMYYNTKCKVLKLLLISNCSSGLYGSCLVGYGLSGFTPHSWQSKNWKTWPVDQCRRPKPTNIMSWSTNKYATHTHTHANMRKNSTNVFSCWPMWFSCGRMAAITTSSIILGSDRKAMIMFAAPAKMKLNAVGQVYESYITYDLVRMCHICMCVCYIWVFYAIPRIS